jgi:hypothetical protein
MMIFISDNGKWMMENSIELSSDGTFDSVNSSGIFEQIYVILGIEPCFYSIFPVSNGFYR